MTALEKALKFTLGDDAGDLGYEGGWANTQDDKGGETFRGVSRVHHPNSPIWPVVDALRSYPEFPACANDDPTLYRLVREFYIDEFWNKVHGDELPEKMAITVFDTAIHSHPSQATKMMQSVLGVVVDGVMGPRSIKAAHDAGEDGVVDMLARRAKFLHEIMDNKPDQKKWAMNWFRRLFRLANVVLEGA